MEIKYESDMTKREKWMKQWKTIQSLRGRARLEYLWTYYRFVLVIVVVIVFIICTIITILHNLAQDTVLSIAFVDAVRQSQQMDEKLEREIGMAMGLSENKKVQIDTSASSIHTDENIAKLTMVMSSVSGNDIVICGQEVYEKYKNAGAFREIKEILGVEYEKYKPYMTNGELDLSKCPGWTNKEYIIYSPAYVCILNSSEHIQEQQKFLDSLI